MNHELYLSDNGIYKKNDIFFYNKTKEQVLDVKILERISKIRVPPAWTSVWYASNKKCHIQVHGIDTSNKKQYILSDEWIKSSSAEKFNRMKSFNIGSFKRLIKLKGLPTQNFSKELLIKLLFNLLIDIHIRVGNEIYAEQNGSYGLTTLRQKHLKFKENIFTLNFVGKSNIKHNIVIPSNYNPYFQQLRLKIDSNSKPLFYYDNFKTISSEELNNYLKENMGKDYTCKDFRTYSANILFIKEFLKLKKQKNKHNIKKMVLKSIDESAKRLGHTRNICRKSYISCNLLNYCLDNESKEFTVSELLSKVWS